ncbi:DUF1566 domain-containing protein [Paraburkholderia sp. USG1]|uniref:DUF1566 domain-containing protein n=1 Tax=Paraburkholderia sp. USG1 TaxID=2952268 RepID=UPI00285E1F27|nr:DUF1566 domain-containing protein [Paraburkholderia sp. USG1]MDR8394985.1 DUF1566 domain-containing protein [Paraburkholderia sp. USG1]
MTITLEAIEAQQSRIAEMIAAFKTQPRASEYRIDAATIPLAPGERFAGPVLSDDGTPMHYLILLPGEAEEVDFQAANEWAGERGATLPTRQEQALLYANLKAEFESSWYWSGETHENDSGWAWCTGFSYGIQDSYDKYDELRARAVRRFIPSVI